MLNQAVQELDRCDRLSVVLSFRSFTLKHVNDIADLRLIQSSPLLGAEATFCR
jgi:hypothetical protein